MNPSRRLAGSIALVVLFLGGTPMGCGPDRREDERPPDVVLITIDTLRADHLGSYGYPERTSPHLDAFAARATQFDTAIAQAPNTIPSVLQIMTSRYGLSARVKRTQRTLAELLRERGYETVAIVDNPLMEFDADAHGLMRGFDSFYRNALVDRGALEGQHYKSNTPADAITMQAARVLEDRDSARPLFLWLHYFDPHDPYAPPFADDLERLSRQDPGAIGSDVRSAPVVKGEGGAPSHADVEQVLALYDAEIRYVDASLGQLFGILEKQIRYDESLVVVSSDHGESFGEHGVWMHGRSLYDGEVRVPLLVKWPGQREGRRVDEPVQAIDIAPTISEAAGVEGPLHFDGTSLRAPGRAPVLILWRDHKVVRTREWKLYETRDETRLFRMTDDPGERRNLAAAHPDVVSRLREARDARLARIRADAAQIRRLTEQAAEQMRALGYLE